MAMAIAEVLNAHAATHERVQLWEGGPYWATTNIGADNPEEYGLYFWWGDTIGHRPSADGRFSFCFYNYNYDNPDIVTYGKSVAELQSADWVTIEGTLVPKHDAAHVKWGGGWRLPTHQEQIDLCTKCDWTWEKLNGVNGFVVRGRGAYGFNSIFLPCAGFGNGYLLCKDGLYGGIWSSNPNSSITGSRKIRIDSSGVYDMTIGSRDLGYSIRPVTDIAEETISAPTDVAAVTHENKQQAVKISWNAVSGATSYRVEYSIDNQSFSALPNCGSLSGTEVNFEWNLSNATMELPRYYRVIAQNATETSEPSAAAEWKYAASVFPSAVYAHSVSHGNGALTIAWDNASNPLVNGLWYTVYRKTSEANADWVKMGDTKSQFWIDGGFSAATRYGSVSYKVQTGNGIYLESKVCEAGRKFGVFVGVDNYENNWCEAREYCVAAVNGFYDRYGGNSYRLRNAEATDAAVVDAFDACSANARPGDSFVYLHASHGYKEGGVYVGSALWHDGTSFTPAELSTALNKFRQGVSIAVILDTCFSGLMPSKVNLTHSGDVGWITSTSGDFFSFGKPGTEDTTPQSFAFTGIVTSGWEYGCADRDNDGYVTILELGRYAEEWSERAFDLNSADPKVVDNGGVLSHMFGGAVGGGTCPFLGSGPLAVSAVPTQSGISVTWSAVAGSAGYEVYRKDGNGEEEPLVRKSAASSFYNDAVEPGHTYTYYIKAYNDALYGYAVASRPLRYMPQSIGEYLGTYWDMSTASGRAGGPFDDEGNIDAAKLNVDHDGDGYSTYQEFIAGTNPRDLDDKLTVRLRLHGSSCEITCEPDLGASRRYRVMGRRTLEQTRASGWTDVTEMSGEERMEYRFFKVEVSIP